MHNDFQSRIKSIVDVSGCCGRQAQTIEMVMEHIAGIALGNGILSGSNPLSTIMITHMQALLQKLN